METKQTAHLAKLPSCTCDKGFESCNLPDCVTPDEEYGVDDASVSYLIMGPGVNAYATCSGRNARIRAMRKVDRLDAEYGASVHTATAGSMTVLGWVRS